MIGDVRPPQTQRKALIGHRKGHTEGHHAAGKGPPDLDVTSETVQDLATEIETPGEAEGIGDPHTAAEETTLPHYGDTEEGNPLTAARRIPPPGEGEAPVGGAMIVETRREVGANLPRVTETGVKREKTFVKNFSPGAHREKVKLMKS